MSASAALIRNPPPRLPAETDAGLSTEDSADLLRFAELHCRCYAGAVAIQGGVNLSRPRAGIRWTPDHNCESAIGA